MAIFHRKTLIKSKEIHCIPVLCDHLQPPPPPPPLPPPPLPLPLPLSQHQSLSLSLKLMFCGLVVSFSFICYLTLYKRYHRALRDTRQRNPGNNTDETHEVFVDEDLGPVVHHPIWLINTIGLEQSVIESIHVFKYKKDEGLIEGTDCSVCLSEFQDDESLRLLPKCSHAFHVPCIDTWLRSHKNCPLCRAPIIKNTTAQTDTTIDSNSIEQPRTTREETPGEEDSETVDHVGVVENNGEVVEKTSRILNETSSGVRVHSDLVDHHRVQEEESVAMRRSVSMDESSASIVHSAVANIPLPDHSSSRLVPPKKPHKLRGSSSSISICSRVIKSSSFGRSSRKASWSCSSTGKVLP